MVAAQDEPGGRQRIIEAARHLFSTHGFHQTAMAELAVEANVSVGQIYRLFKGKSEIVVAIVEEDSRQRLGDTIALCERVESGEIGIDAAMTQLTLRALSEGDEALSFEILAEAHRNPAVAATITDLCLRCRKVFRKFAGIVNPALSDHDLDAAEDLLLACMFGLGHRTLSVPRLACADTAEQTARMIMAALRAPGTGLPGTAGAWREQATAVAGD